MEAFTMDTEIRTLERAAKLGDAGAVERLNAALARTPGFVRTVRKFSAYGPCLTLGQLVRETRTQLVFVNVNTGAEKRAAKSRSEIHTTPCVSCVDHSTTQYPNGYGN